MPAFHRLPLLALALAPATLSAQTTEPETIIVTGQGLADQPGDRALDVVTIDRDRITQNASQRLENVLADVAGLPKQARVLVRDVRIVSIGGQQTVPSSTSDELGATQDVVPVTLALEPKDSLAVTYAAAFALEVRLIALPGDVGANRGNEVDDFDANDLGGKAVPEEAGQ